MVHSMLRVVLSLLVLLPSGICVCGVDAQSCSNHPTTEAVQVPDHPEQSECSDPCFGPVLAGNSRAHHRCAVPLPHHHPSCPVVAPASVQTAIKNALTVTPDRFAEPVVRYLCFETIWRPIAPIPIDISAPPLFLAHCVLVI